MISIAVALYASEKMTKKAQDPILKMQNMNVNDI